MKAKVYHQFDFGEIALAKYCVDGLHVELIRRGYGEKPSRTVSVCDGTCQGAQTQKEVEFSAEAIAELREELRSQGHSK